MSFHSFQRNLRESGDSEKLCIIWLFCISIASIVFWMESDYMSWIPSWNLYIVAYIIGILFFVVWMFSLE